MSEHMRPLIERLPDHYQRSAPARELQRVVGLPMDRLWADREDLLDQLWVDTATWGLSWWETWCGIPVDRSAGYELRRSRVKAKLRGRGTTTVELIQATAGAYVDAQIHVEETPGEHRFTVVFSDIRSQPPELSELTGSINEIKPAHLDYDYLFVYDWTGVVELSQEVRGSTLIYHYKLGAWALGQAPFGTMEEEALLMSGPQQIMPPLLEGTAAFTASEIRAARVNGTVRVEDFEIKAADGATVTVRYYLQPEQAARVERLELLGEGDKVLTAAAVDVTLRGPTLLTHIIPVKEGS